MKNTHKLLLYGILFDGIGMLSFVIPVLAELTDVIWAPISAYLIYKMYKGTKGKVAGFISLFEEAGVLGTDFIPTFTLTWIYTYLVKKRVDLENPAKMLKES